MWEVMVEGLFLAIIGTVVLLVLHVLVILLARLFCKGRIPW